MSLAGHVSTIWPILLHHLRPQTPPVSEAVTFQVPDPELGAVQLSGRLSGSGKVLVILVHGLSGCTESRYMIAAARVAEAMGIACLRLNLRGSDRQGGDLYHAGLSADLLAVLESPRLASYERIYAMGFSLGGHLVLKAATEVQETRLRAVAGICPPLDLSLSVRFFDRPDRAIYRRYVLAGLCDIYAEVVARRELSISAAEARQIRRLREWDGLTVVPRFGYQDAADYYRSESVGPRIHCLKIPTLLVVTSADPMVPPEVCVRPCLESVPEPMDLRWLKVGGHNNFPRRLSLGEDGPAGIEGQTLTWLLRH